MDEALVEFEVRYFVNVQLNLRVAVRSEVLLAIMAQFKAAGIEAPIPPFRIEVDNNAMDAKMNMNHTSQKKFDETNNSPNQ